MARARGSVVAGVVLAATLVAGSWATAETVWIHASVDTRGGPGEQVSTYRAFTTSDQAGTQRISVEHLCVKGIGHETRERCEANVATVELIERTVGLPGIGSLCVEAVASATSRVGPLAASARACP